MTPQADAIVAGAGPVGCVAALAMARKGARVRLIDPAPDTSKRFAGELLHPAAMDALRAVGIDHLEAAASHPPVRGYAVNSHDAPGERFLLESGTRQGATFVFHRFLQQVREVAASHPLIEWMPRCRVTGVEGQTVSFEDRRGDARVRGEVSAPLVVGAIGKRSPLRKALGVPRAEPLSRMAGVMVRGVTLLHEGYGHVSLGRVGPALIYRVGEDEVRLCLDVPAPWKRAPRRMARIWEAYRDVLPASIAPAVKAELEAGRVSWAVNSVHARTHYGRPGLAFVGDAVGWVHPMTAIGMTMGFTDALALAEAPDLDTYARRRHRDSQAPVLLSTALYEIFTVQSEPTDALRRAVYHLWRTRPDLCDRSMQLLNCDETRMGTLVGMGARLVALASADLARRSGGRDLFGTLSSVQRIAGLVHWLVNESVPEPMRIPWVTRAATPFAALRQHQEQRLAAELAGGPA